jgi:hypothetical protein
LPLIAPDVGRSGITEIVIEVFQKHRGRTKAQPGRIGTARSEIEKITAGIRAVKQWVGIGNALVKHHIRRVGFRFVQAMREQKAE